MTYFNSPTSLTGYFYNLPTILFHLYILVTTPAVNTDSLRSLSRICFPNWLHMHMQCMALVPIERRTKSSQWSPMIHCTSVYILDCWQRGRRWPYPSRDVRQHCQNRQVQLLLDCSSRFVGCTSYPAACIDSGKTFLYPRVNLPRKRS